MLRWPVTPMRAAAVADLPEPSTREPALYEPKWDGFRAVVWWGPDGVRVQSRPGRDLSRYFPDLCEQLASQVPARVVLDGELIIWDPERGTTSFTALQRRITAGRGLVREAVQRPAHFVAFDLLQDGRGRELLEQPLTRRRQALQRLLRSAPPQLQLCPQTSDPVLARTWFTDWAVSGIEGLIIKPARGRYRPGEPGWLKYKARRTEEFIVGGVTGALTRPTALLVGRFDQRGVLRFLGQTHRLRAGQQPELAGLRPMTFQGDGAGHPWPCPLPAAWAVNLTDRQPLPYLRVEPELVAEVDTDLARDGVFGRQRHLSRFVRIRPDLRVEDVPHLIIDAPAFAGRASRSAR